jgi:hypothetical protein
VSFFIVAAASCNKKLMVSIIMGEVLVILDCGLAAAVYTIHISMQQQLI